MLINKQWSSTITLPSKEKAFRTSRRLGKFIWFLFKAVTTLDQRKDEAIVRTFKQVSMGFSKIFESLYQLVEDRLLCTESLMVVDRPWCWGGSWRKWWRRDQWKRQLCGKLRWSRHQCFFQQQRGWPATHWATSRWPEIPVCSYFKSCYSAVWSSSLYLFDEIDANLDTQYRVPQWPPWFQSFPKRRLICTTFRNEMIHVAEKFYGVMFNNKMSSIASITREEALSFVEGQQPR